MFCSCLLFKTLYFSDFCLTNFYLNIYRTGINKICRIGRTLEAVDERFEVIFSVPRETLPWQLILWTKSISFPYLVVSINLLLYSYLTSGYQNISSI